MVESRSVALKELVANECARNHYDMVVASQLDMMPYALEIPGVPAILEEVELASYLEPLHQSNVGLALLRRWLTWLKLKSYIRRNVSRFEACTVVSEVEHQHLRAVLRDDSTIVVVPNAVDTSSYDVDWGPVQPLSLIWCGSITYGPNYEAIKYFLDEIYPHVKSVVPGVKLRITGQYEANRVGSLRDIDGVEFTGYLADVRPAIARSWASVVPLRSGGGTRLKVLESMALGTPVVATGKGAEGLDVMDDENILIASDADSFARAVVRLFGSDDLRARLARGGLELVRSRYDWSVVAPRFLALVEKCMNPDHTRGEALATWP
jgi:polysaccharide biosynthesis protein PslH